MGIHQPDVKLTRSFAPPGDATGLVLCGVPGAQFRIFLSALQAKEPACSPAMLLFYGVAEADSNLLVVQHLIALSRLWKTTRTKPHFFKPMPQKTW